MRTNTLALLAFLFAAPAFSQNTNVAFRSKMTFPGQTVANVWGYTAAEREYALIGASKGLIIADITDPDAPVQIVQIPGPNNLWKEVRTYGHYAYIVTEGGSGVQIVDLSKLPSANLDYHYYTGDGPIEGQLGKIHALDIDEAKGFLYAYGGNLFNGGAKVLDLNADPYNPTYAGKFDQLGYIHDGYVENDTMYSGHIYQGRFAIVDMTDKNNPQLLATQNTPDNFTHNTWLTDDRKTLLTTDERANSFLAAYDVSDPENIRLLDKIQSNPGSNSAVHNTIILGNFAITSWYKDGFTIVDITRPDNLVQVGNYDTYPVGAGSGFDGCWGAYPYFPSGTIIASTINVPGANVGELWVLTPTYVRACYLEGTITNGLTGNPLAGATIEVVGGDQTTTLPDGTFKTGQGREGYATVRISRIGFQSQEFTVYFQRGDVRLLNTALYPTNGLVVDGQVIREADGAAIPNATVALFSFGGAWETTTGADGSFRIEGMMPGLYDIAAGAEGYGQTMLFKQKITTDKTLVLVIPSESKAIHGPDAAAKRTQTLGDDTRLTAWPNPFFEEFRLEIPTDAGACRLEVVDFAGRVIEQRDVPTDTGILRLGENWAPGVYALRVVGAGAAAVQVTLVKM
jgi:choice-of-anchor B domain-containing protein